MCRFLFTGFFAFLLIFQSLDRFGMIAYYELNKEYITEMFCVNTSKPELGCEGKCFLRKQLNKKDQNENKYPGNALDVKEIHLFPIKTFFDLNLTDLLEKSDPGYVNCWYGVKFIHEVLQPPK